MSKNLILDEIHAAREKLLADHDGNVHAYVEDARRRALASGRPIATPSRRIITLAPKSHASTTTK